MKKPALVDQYGRPVETGLLPREIAAASTGSVRSPVAGYPGDGLNPVRLASILREADMGDPVRYLELAETIEERNPHYAGVLGTRRRAVSQIEPRVEAASDAAEDVAIADMVTDWLKRDELADEMFHILDAVPKGYSFTEILWDRSEGQWMPERLVWRDPRWFRFGRRDLDTPMMLGDSGREEPLPAFKFIHPRMPTKSGLPLRGGLARLAAWNWMFKAFSERDWAIFTQTYGQPVRVGKYGPGATDEEKATLMRAVANIAGDMAAIVPETMLIEFVESRSVGASSDLYLRRVDWLDQQMSKAVLGQTATTDAIAGGHAVGQEHREVQEDIERADCRALAAALNRDLIRPWVQLERGPQKRYPRLVIARPEKEDLTAFATAIAPMIDRGLRVRQKEVRERFGIAEPGAQDELMAAASPKTAPTDTSGDPATVPPDPGSKIKRVSGEIKRGEGLAGTETAPQAEGPLAALPAAPDAVALLTDRLAEEAAPAMGAILGQIEAMMTVAGSLEELREMLAAFGDVDAALLAAALSRAFLAAELGGRAAVTDAGAET